MTTTLVTGGAGFIGSNLAKALLNEGHTVKIIDDLSTGHKENIPMGVEFINGSITDMETVKKAVVGVEHVFHLAAMASVPRSIKMPLETTDVNVNGTLNILLASRDAGVKRVVFSSSASIYGDSPVLPKKENMPPNPKSPYGLTKYTAEKYTQLFYSLYGLETVALRYFNVYGPNQDPNSQYSAVIPKFITSILTNKKITIDGDGEQSRDFTYVKDAVRANMMSAVSKKGAGEIFNIAGGKTVTLNQLKDMICEITGKKADVSYGPVREGDIKHSLADITKARETIGYSPRHGFKEGLTETIRWYRDGLQMS